ncbi:MAG: hypothetical protein ACRDYC_07075, partial [Acidimicrobiales bacterium]
MTGEPEIMHISDAELSRMTRDLDQMHREQSLPALERAVGEWVEAISEERSAGQREIRRGRRTFLLGAGAAAGAGLMAACGSTSNKSTPPPTTKFT